jgi:tetratricopeptide (TPR) repeat protein
MWLVAAQHETERFGHRESIDILEHARTLTAQLSNPDAHACEIALLAQIGDAHLQLGDMRQSIEAFQMAANLAAARGSIAQEADALMLIAHPAAFVDPDRGIGACERAATLADTMNDSVLRARATMHGAGWRILIDGWDANVADRYKGAMTELLRLDKTLSPYGHTMIARMQGLQSDYDHAYAHVDDAVRTLTTVNRLWELAPALAVKMFTLVFLGRLGEAHETITTALALATKNHNTTWLAIFRSYLAWIHLLSCDFEGVRDLSTTQLMANPTTQAQVQMTVFEGFAALRTSRVDAAQECFDRAGRQLTSSKAVLSWYWSAFVELGKSELALSRGDVVGASRQASDLIGAVSHWEESFVKVLAWELGARTALVSANHQLAKERIERALLTVTQCGLQSIAWRVHATAWRLYAKHDAQHASKHQTAAQAAIRQVGQSLDCVESLQRTFLADPAVRDVVEGVVAQS